MIHSMKDLREVSPEERHHYMRCGECEEWFDMRDLAAVVDHQHLPEQTFSQGCFGYTQEEGLRNEYYVKVNGRMITLRLRRPKNGWPKDMWGEL